MSADRPQNTRAELVAPAGNLQKLKVAIAFGADAVYLSGQRLNLRSQSENFTHEQTVEAIEYARAREVRVYILLNAFPHNEHLAEMRDHLGAITSLRPDAVVVSDIGAFELTRETAPAIPIHISTQANITNWRTARFWERMGASRIILARELSLNEISEIASHVTIKLEIFVHGAMCMAYSGRCFMSKHFVGRDPNLGDCAQPCRWTYRLVEETRPGEVLEIEGHPDGTLVFSSRDLCLIEHLPEVIASGVQALKIEGRMKTPYYVGITTRAYRNALDLYHSNPDACRIDVKSLEELRKTSNRDFTTGFYLGEMQAGLTPPGGARRTSTYSFLGVVTSIETRGGKVEVRGPIRTGDVIECVQPDRNDFDYEVDSMLDKEGNAVEVVHPNNIVYLPGLDAQPFSLLRRSNS
jgi:putative protease